MSQPTSNRRPDHEDEMFDLLEKKVFCARYTRYLPNLAATDD